MWAKSPTQRTHVNDQSPSVTAAACPTGGAPGPCRGRSLDSPRGEHVRSLDSPPPGLCMCAPTPTPTCVWVHCTCVHCRMHAHATRVHGTPWAHTRCAHYMSVTQRVSHTPPTCTCCCTATHTRVFQPPERQAFLALRSLITRLVSICVGAGGSRRTSSFPTPAGGAGRGRRAQGPRQVAQYLSTGASIPGVLVNLTVTL